MADGEEEASAPPPYAPAALAWVLAFLAGIGDVYSLVMFEAFSAAMTGNIILLGLSVGPVELKARAGVTGTPWFYLAIIGSNLIGNLIYRVLDIRSKAPGIWSGVICGVLIITTASKVAESPWWVVITTLCYGMHNALATSVPLGENTLVMTGNLHKLPAWIIKAVTTQELPTVPVGMLLPIATLFGALVGGGLLLLDNGQFYTQPWIGIILGILLSGKATASRFVNLK